MRKVSESVLSNKATIWSLEFEISEKAIRNFKCELEKLIKGRHIMLTSCMIEVASFSSAMALSRKDNYEALMEGYWVLEKFVNYIFTHYYNKSSFI